VSLEPHLAFFNSSLLGQPDSLEKIIFSLQQNGFTCNEFYVGSYLEPNAHWNINSPDARKGLEIAYDEHNFNFTIKNEFEEFELLLHFNWNVELDNCNKRAHIGAVTFQTGYFHSDEKKAIKYSRVLLNFGKLLYSLTQPDFGWIDFHEPAGSTWFDDIDRLAVPYIYWANFFGKGYANKYGAEILIRSPAWSSELLDDGGVLVLLSPILGFNNNVEQVKTYFDNITREIS
jgi:hypothetical protein